MYSATALSPPLRYATIAAKLALSSAALVLAVLPLSSSGVGEGASLLEILERTGYLLVMRGVAVLGAALLISGRPAPLGVLLLGPLALQLLFFHARLAPSGLPLSGGMVALLLFLAWRHREHFAPFFQPRREHCTFRELQNK